ncbi:hypothetical protein EI291_16425 [Hymenobacter rigui]|uniref:TonB C-terminal domain-containing protein n=1 Tax=Hymenobacter rigui TaxID=334424 RepID=A0A428KL34_9BACT|nr:hypothetical protein EI291_16425 [Hymenobacter rigui]
MPLVVGRQATSPYGPTKVVPPVARFWLKPDSASAQQAQTLVALLMRRTGLPDAFLRHKDYTTHADEGIIISFFFLAVVRPDGTVGSVTLQKQTGDEERAYSPESIALLADEGRRAIKTLRFEAAATQDSLTIPLHFRL